MEIQLHVYKSTLTQHTHSHMSTATHDAPNGDGAGSIEIGGLVAASVYVDYNLIDISNNDARTARQRTADKLTASSRCGRTDKLYNNIAALQLENGQWAYSHKSTASQVVSRVEHTVLCG